MKKRTIFYSWQSDLPEEGNREFIQKALDGAVQEIDDKGELKIEPVVERDTKGVPGSPDIANTILSRIDNCSVFVADVSIVNPDARSRKTPNPNVMIELGYALKALGDTKILMVQNGAYGIFKELPFDLTGRRVLSYKLEEGSTSTKSIQQGLKNEVKDEVLLILKATDKEEEENFPLDVELSHKKGLFHATQKKHI